MMGTMPRRVGAQSDPDDEISGTVTDTDGNAVDGATVVAVPHDESYSPLVTTTDASGSYTFSSTDLHAGDKLYHVVARNGTQSDPQRSQEDYPFLMATGQVPAEGDLHAWYDATELSLSDQDSVTTWTDETGNGHDLTAGTSPTYVTNGINGNSSVRFDGVDDFLDVAFSTLSQPNTIFIVLDASAGGGAQHVYDSEDGSNNRNAIDTDSDDSWVMFAGNVVTGGNNSQSPQMLSALYSGSSSILRQDGTQVINGDAGTQGLNGFTLGSRHDQSAHFTGDIGEVLIYPQDKSGIFSDVESYLSNKWGL